MSASLDWNAAELTGLAYRMLGSRAEGDKRSLLEMAANIRQRHN